MSKKFRSKYITKKKVFRHYERCQIRCPYDLSAGTHNFTCKVEWDFFVMQFKSFLVQHLNMIARKSYWNIDQVQGFCRFSNKNNNYSLV